MASWKSPFRCGTIAEEGHHHLRLLAILDTVADAHRMEGLGTHRNGDGQIVSTWFHRPAFVITGKVEEEAFQALAAPNLGSRLTEGRDHPIFRLENRHGTKLCRFLALDRAKGANPALTLEAQHALIKAARQDHGSMQAQQQLHGDDRLQVGVEMAIFVEYRKVLHAVW
jgi:hypothetical protein